MTTPEASCPASGGFEWEGRSSNRRVVFSAGTCRIGVRRSTDLPPRFGQRVAARIDGVLAELLFDAQELVVFRQTVRAAEGAGLDLAAVRRHRDVGDGGILGFAGAMAEDGAVAAELRELHGVERLGERAVWFSFTRTEVAVRGAPRQNIEEAPCISTSLMRLIEGVTKANE